MLEKKRLLLKQKQEAELIKQKNIDEEKRDLDKFLINMKKQPHEIAAQVEGKEGFCASFTPQVSFGIIWTMGEQ